MKSLLKATAFFVAHFLALGLMIHSAAGEFIQKVTSERTPWTGELTGDCLGGNEKQIQDGSSSPRTDPAIAKELRTLLPWAKNKDVVFVHLNFELGFGKWDGSLELYPAVEGKINLADKEVRADFWEHLADAISAQEGKAGIQTKLEWEKTTTTGGFPAYTALFTLSQPNSSTMKYFIRHFVVRQHDVHRFELGTLRDIDARTKEFDRLLRSVRYSP